MRLISGSGYPRLSMDLPIGANRALALKGIADTILGGWEMSGILTFEAGIPVAVAYGVDNLGGAGTTRPNLLSNPNETQRILPDQYFTKSAFGDPVPLANVLRDGQNVILAAGNAGRAPIIGPGVQTFDLGIFKNFAITERLRAQLRGEFFNALNHANSAIPTRRLPARSSPYYEHQHGCESNPGGVEIHVLIHYARR